MYQTFKGSAHPLAPTEIAITAVPEDERVWVPQAEGVWFRPLMLNTLQGQWCNLLRVRRAGILSRHLHPAPVHGYVIKGRWHYLEHDWVAETGSYVFEPPGEIHTLTVPEDCAGDDHLLQHLRLHGLSRQGQQADRLRGRLHQDRHVPQALRRASGWAPTTWTSSCADLKAPSPGPSTDLSPRER